MHPHVTLVTLGVSDLERSVRFYRDGLGFRLTNDAAEQKVAFFQLANIALGLWSADKLAHDAGASGPGTGFRGVTLAHNVPTPEDVDAVMALAARSGARITKPAAKTFWGGYSGYFEDPDGHSWEVAHNPFWPLDADGRAQLSP